MEVKMGGVDYIYGRKEWIKRKKQNRGGGLRRTIKG